MPLPVIFGPLSAAQMSQLDQNFAALGNLCVIPGTVTGTNSLVFSPAANTPTIGAYVDNLVFATITVNANSTTMHLQIGSLASMPVYKDSLNGPILLSGGEIAAHNYVQFAYDSTLNSGGGGFHVMSDTIAQLQQSGQFLITNNSGVTLTAAELTGGGLGLAIINRAGSPGSPFTDTTDTAVAILAGLPGSKPGTIFRFRVVNGTAQTQTLGAGSNVLVAGTATTAAGATHEFEGLSTGDLTTPVIIYG
jgi:hypothetical protein